MAEEAFASGRCDAGQKLEALDAVADAARELAALPPVDRRADDEKDKSNRGGVVARVGKERRFAPKSLARLRDGIGHNAPRRTRAHLVGGALAYPLLAHTAAMLRRAEEDAARVTAAERDAKKTKHPNDEDAAHVPGGGVDAVVLGRALGALGECCAAARNARTRRHSRGRRSNSSRVTRCATIRARTFVAPRFSPPSARYRRRPRRRRGAP